MGAARKRAHGRSRREDARRKGHRRPLRLGAGMAEAEKLGSGWLGEVDLGTLRDAPDGDLLAGFGETTRRDTGGSGDVVERLEGANDALFDGRQEENTNCSNSSLVPKRLERVTTFETSPMKTVSPRSTQSGYVTFRLSW